MLRVIFVLFFIFSTGSVMAEKETDKSAVQLSVSAGNIGEQKKVIESKITNTEYLEMKNEDRTILLNQLDEIENGELTSGTITSYQNNINNILNTAFADSKRVCTREKNTGSNMPVKTCMTVAAKDRQYQQMQKSKSTGPSSNSAIK